MQFNGDSKYNLSKRFQYKNCVFVKSTHNSFQLNMEKATEYNLEEIVDFHNLSIL